MCEIFALLTNAVACASTLQIFDAPFPVRSQFFPNFHSSFEIPRQQFAAVVRTELARSIFLPSKVKYVIWSVARLNYSLMQAKSVSQIKYLSRFRFNSFPISCSAEYTYAENAQKQTLDFTTCSTNWWPLFLPLPSLHCECHCVSFYLRIFEMHPFGSNGSRPVSCTRRKATTRENISLLQK